MHERQHVQSESPHKLQLPANRHHGDGGDSNVQGLVQSRAPMGAVDFHAIETSSKSIASTDDELLFEFFHLLLRERVRNRARRFRSVRQ